MRYTTGLLMLLALSLTACEMDNSGRVAVIDLDQIASVTGRDKVINESVQTFSKNQQVQLTTLRDQLRNNIEQEQKKLGKKPAKNKQEKVNQLTQTAELKLRQEVTKVEEAVGQLRVKLVMDFKKEVEPVARRVATQRGMSVIMIKQNGMLYVAPAADITDGVIDELQKISAVNNKVAAVEPVPAEVNKSNN